MHVDEFFSSLVGLFIIDKYPSAANKFKYLFVILESFKILILQSPNTISKFPLQY